MTVTLKVYEADNSTHVDDLTTARGIRWVDDLTGPGRLQFEFSAGDESSSSLVRIDRVIRVDVDGTAVFAGTVRRQVKRRLDNDSAVVQVTCVGLRGLLDTSVVYPAGGVTGTPLVLEPSTRWYGWMSKNTLFDHSSWTAAASHGTYNAAPFSTVRPDDWPASAGTAEYIWSTHTSGVADPGIVYFRKSFTTSADQAVVFIGTADDEVEWFLDGQSLGRIGGAFQWRQYLSRSFTLPAGSHVLSARGVNYTRPYGDGKSLAYIIGALLAADPNGDPAQTNETWTLHNNATGGTFTLTFDDLSATAPIAYNASAATVESALEATAATLDVTVTGSGTSGDPWVIVADGPEQAGTAHSLTVNSSGLTGGTSTLTNTVDGAYAELIVKTDTTWRHLPYPSSVPGVTFGAIFDDLFDESKARGELVGLSSQVTPTLDGDGTASWTTELVLAIPVGTTLGRVCQMLEDAGADVHVAPDGEVDVWEGGGGTDLSQTVAFAYADNVTSVEHNRDGARVDRLLIRTDDGWAQVEAPSVSGVQPRSGFVSAGSFTTDAEFDLFADELLDTYAGQADTTTWSIADENAQVPYVDFDLRDDVAVTDWQAVPGRQTVLTIAAQVDDADGTVEWTCEAQDTGLEPTAAPPPVVWHTANASSNGQQRMYELNRNTFAVVRSDPGFTNNPGGIGGSQTRAWVTNQDNQAVHEFNVSTFANIAGTSGRGHKGVGGKDNVLYSAHGGSTDKVRKLDPNTRAILLDVNAPATGAQGIGGDADAVWNADSNADRIYRLNPSTLAATGSGSLSGEATGDPDPVGAGGSSGGMFTVSQFGAGVRTIAERGLTYAVVMSAASPMSAFADDVGGQL